MISDAGFKRLAKVVHTAQSGITKFYGELEILDNGRSAIVTLFDNSGEWAGSQRIDTKNGDESSLYEVGYNYASVAAEGKGGRLETFKTING
jgi:hypothetical protein